MKRFLTLLILLIVCCSAYAQKMSVASFERLDNDLDARVYSPREDFNGSLAALIKIETTVKGLFFEGGSLGIVDVDDSQIAETWVYIPYGATKITIKHPQLGIIRNYEFPIAIEKATVYKMQLTTAAISQVVTEDVGGQFLVLNTEPSDVVLSIDGGEAVAITGGVTTQFLSYGEHTITVSSDMYESYTTSVEMFSERVNLDVELKPSFGFISVDSTPNAKVVLDGAVLGTTPVKSSSLAFGKHSVTLSAPGYESVTREVTLNADNRNIELNESLDCFMSRIELRASSEEDAIFINDIDVGRGEYSELMMPGSYHVRVVRNGYRDRIMRLDVERNNPQSVVLEPLEPKYGTLRVESNIVDAEIEIDGERVGLTPNVIKNILAKTHTVTLKKNGYSVATRQVEVSEGKITSVNVKMSEMANIAEYVSTPTYTPTVAGTSTTPKREKTKLMTNISWIGSMKTVSYDFSTPIVEKYNVNAMPMGFMFALARKNGAYVKGLWSSDSRFDLNLSSNSFDDYWWDDIIKSRAFIAGYTRRLTGDAYCEYVGICGYVGLGYEKQIITRVRDDDYSDYFIPDQPIENNNLVFDIGFNFYFGYIVNLTIGYYTAGGVGAFQLGYGVMF